MLYVSLQTEPSHSHVDLKADAESGGRSNIANGVEASKTRSKIHFNFSCVPVVLPETSCSIRLWTCEGEAKDCCSSGPKGHRRLLGGAHSVGWGSGAVRDMAWSEC